MVGVLCLFFGGGREGGGAIWRRNACLDSPLLLLARKIDEKGEIYINYFQERRNGRSVCPIAALSKEKGKGVFYCVFFFFGLFCAGN